MTIAADQRLSLDCWRLLKGSKTQASDEFTMYYWKSPLDLNTRAQHNNNLDDAGGAAAAVEAQRKSGFAYSIPSTSHIAQQIINHRMRGSLDSGHGVYSDPRPPRSHHDLLLQQPQQHQSQFLHYNRQALFFHSPSFDTMAPPPAAAFLRQQSSAIRNLQSLPQNTSTPVAGPASSAALPQDLPAVPRSSSSNREVDAGADRARPPLPDAFAALQHQQGGMATEANGPHKNSDSTPRILGVEVQVKLEEQGVSFQRDDVYTKPTSTVMAEAAEQPCHARHGTAAIAPYYQCCSSSSCTGKHTIQSPSWLPHGWVTEVQIRQTGNTAGTRDKYYKDLISGRRFRSRNEVIHFLETGKGRVRRRHKGKKLIAHMDATSAYPGPSSSILNYQQLNQVSEKENGHATTISLVPDSQHITHIVHDFPPSAAHQRQFFTPTHRENLSQKPSLSPETDNFDDTHSGFIGFSLPPVPVAAPELLSSAHLLLPSSSHHPAAMTGFGFKRAAPQMQVLHKKRAKPFSHDKDINLKQASRLYQWLQKPAAAPKSDVHREMIDISSESSVELLPEGSERTVMEEDLERGIEAAQRTVELGKDVQTAQRTVIQLGKEMKTLVEKLGHNVQVVQRAVKMKKPDDTVDNNLSVDLGNHMIERANHAICNAIHAAKTIDTALASVVQAAERIDGAVGNIIHASQKLEVSMNNVIQATHNVMNSPRDSTSQVTTSNIIQTATSTGKPFYPLVENVKNSNEQINVTLKSTVQRTQQPIFAMNNSPVQSTQGGVKATLYRTSQIFDADLTGKETQAILLPIRADIAQAALIPVVPVANVVTHILPAQIQQPFATASVIRPSVSFEGPHNRISCIEAFPESIHDTAAIIQSSQLPVACVKHLEEKTTSNNDGAIITIRDTTHVNKSIEESKQIAHVKSRKFTLLSPKFDLSRIHPNMTSRQRSKMVQKMKMTHGRGLLAALGRELCYIALGRRARIKVLNLKPCPGSSCQAWINNTIMRNGKQDEIEEEPWSKDDAVYFESHVLKETQREFDHFSEVEDDTSTDDATEVQ